MKDDVVIIIPAYNPDDGIEDIIIELKKNGYKKIVIVNDGSRQIDILKKLEETVTILTHEKNEGKGMALKTGFKYVYYNLKNVIGVITMDADGQHKIEDINKIYFNLKLKNHVILGCRDFKKNTPLKSKIGNLITRFVFDKRMKVKLIDTQTGLRGIPFKYLQDLRNIDGCRFEYEMNMLIYCIRNNIAINEIGIETVYIDRNKKTNYRIITDSLKIYKRIITIKNENKHTYKNI